MRVDRWIERADEPCPACHHHYALELEARCVACDHPVCPICTIHVRETRETFCPGCRPSDGPKEA